MIRRKMDRFGSGSGVAKQMPTSAAMGSMDMAKGGIAKSKVKAKAKAKAKTKGKAEGKAEGKAMMALAMIKDRMGRAMADRGAEASMAPPAPMASAAPPMAPMASAAPPMGAPGMKKGGKAKAKAKDSVMATKFGAAMMKKSADTKGRAMKKFAKGGSIDGCATRGKTKARMAMGGMAGYKRGGKTC